jgi:septal ring factor EnvC (AmiA/AmiB activator)
MRIVGGIMICAMIITGAGFAMNLNDTKNIREITDQMAVIVEDITVANTKKDMLESQIQKYTDSLGLVNNHIQEQNETLDVLKGKINAIINQDEKSFM